MTTALPGVTSKLFTLTSAGKHAEAIVIHNQLNSLWNALSHDNLPACVTYIQHGQGLPLFAPRKPMESVSDEPKRRVEAALSGLI